MKKRPVEGLQPHGDDTTFFAQSMDGVKKAGGVAGEAKKQEKPEAQKHRSREASMLKSLEVGSQEAKNIKRKTTYLRYIIIHGKWLQFCYCAYLHLFVLEE